MGADATGIYLSASYVTGIDSPENKKFLEAANKKFGADLKTPNDLSVPEYEAVYLYKAAVEKAGSTDAAKVIEALPTVSFTGPARRDRDGQAAPCAAHHVSRPGAERRHRQGRRDFKDVDPGEQCPNLK